MGVVYRAWDPELRRMVALKVIAGSREAPVEDAVFERFAREAQSAASLSHPNIVTIYDFGRDAGRPYIVMELVDGESMAQMIQAKTAMPLPHRVRLAAELCEGLAYAHGRGLIHRDVKPANLMITAGGVLKILDFGLARLTDDLVTGGLTQTGAVMGTPQYMSPEQVSGLTADARSDIFAVGTVLYELFTGQMAFGGENSALIRLMILHDSPRPMSEVVQGFPRRLTALVEKAMEKDRARRYQSLEALAAELRDWEPDESVGEHVERTSRTGGEASELADSPALSGMLDEWEHLVGQALDAPAETVPPPTERERKPVASEAPSMTSSKQPARPAAAPKGNAAPRTGVPRSAIVVLLLVASLAAAGVYFRKQPGVAEPPRSAPQQEPREPSLVPGVPAPVEAQPSRATPEPGGERPASAAPRAGESQAGERPGDSRAAPRPAQTTAAPPSAEVTARCREILQRVGLGEELIAGDRDFLTKQCRDRSR